MTNESNSGPKGAQEDDPLSATAMFFRTLDQQAAGNQQEPAKFDFGSAPAQGEPKTPPARPLSGSDKGEFTAIFGSASPAGMPAAPSPPKPVPSEAIPSSWQEPAPPANQSQGEFTRIFVKGASTPSKPVAKASEPATEAALPRAQGFSSPGISDAASAQTSFSQFFKPISKTDAAAAEPVNPPSPPAFRPGPSRTHSAPDPFRMDSPLAAPARESSAPAQDPQSITSLIQALSSQASSSAGARGAETAPYRQESPAPLQPAAKPSAPSEFESGGVTQFIQRLAEMPPAPVAEAPPAMPVREQDSGPGEYTRIISAPTRSIANPPAAPAVSSAPPAPAPPPTPAFVRPVMPAMPAAPAIPPTPVVAPHAAPHAAPMAMQLPVIPTPHLPPVPSPPAVGAPKGKLEALVPMLLVVNTFLLVVILVVMIFLIKAR